jgi:Mrp family chromosome partitioning ATPase
MSTINTKFKVSEGVSPGPAVHAPPPHEGERPVIAAPGTTPRLSPRDTTTVTRRRGAEPYDALLWRLQARQTPDAGRCVTLGLIGSERRVGVTTVATNLAVRASELQLGPVLLVETTPGKMGRNNLWSTDSGPGLAQLLAGDASYNECLRPGPGGDLSILPAGALGLGETSILEPGAIDALLAEACADHRLVVFDLPAAEELQQMLLLARQLDQVLLVLRSGSTRQRDVERVADRLIEDGVPLAGAVLNRQRSCVPSWLKRWM